jgi:hypothetical protein
MAMPESRARAAGLKSTGYSAKRLASFLAAAFLALCEALLAVDRTVSRGFKGNFALLLTFCASHLKHLPWPPAESTTTLLECHIASFVFGKALKCLVKKHRKNEGSGRSACLI